jgi:molecular chaperone DnaK
MVDSTIFQTEKQISEFDDKLTEEDRESLTAKLEELKKVYEEKDFENMDDSLQSLNETWAGISTRLYQETSSDETEDVDDVETTDVEVEEVKE